MSDPLALVRRHELQAIIVGLDQAIEVLQLCNLMETTDGTGGTLLAVPLRNSHRIERAIRCAADFLDSLQYDGRV